MLYDYEEPINHRKIVKKISVNGVWEERVFYQVIVTETAKNNAKSWLSDQYGISKYGLSWWTTYSTLVMNEQIYTHWKLLQ